MLLSMVLDLYRPASWVPEGSWAGDGGREQCCDGQMVLRENWGSVDLKGLRIAGAAASTQPSRRPGGQWSAMSPR